VFLIRRLGRDIRDKAVGHFKRKCLQSNGQYVEAAQMHRQTLELERKVLGPKHPDTLMSMNDLGSAVSRQGKHVEAEQMHRQTLELRRCRALCTHTRWRA
jgi:hypothetical protein